MDAENNMEPTRPLNLHRNNNNSNKERIMQSAHGKESSEASASGGNNNSAGGFANTYVAATTKATTTTTVAATTTTTTTTAATTTSTITTEEVHQQEAHIEAPEIETPTIVEEQPAAAAPPPAQTSYTPAHGKGNDEQDEEPILPIPTVGPTDEELRLQYESQFPPKPENPRAATTFALFSDPHRFSPQSIANTLHYITDNLGGRAWLDVDGNGKRGSESDSTLNAAEWDNGVGGVQVQLVECESDIPLFTKTSLPNNGVGEGSSVKKSDLEEAGLYNFPFTEASDIPIGRYYLMYRAPNNYRLSGNTLPLSRQETEDGAYFDCIPKGGEGGDFLETVQDSGDLDQGGYCARSIGCFEVSPHFKLDKDFVSLDYLSGSAEEYTGTFQNLVAMPSESYFNVGLSEEVWPLGTYQFADSTITLSFPKSVNEEMLGSAVPKDFGKSDVKKSLEDAIARKIVRELGEFALQGVEVNGGFVVPAASNRKKKRGLLRRRRGLQEEEEDSEGEASITYTLTTRGSYSPPPRVQLGDIMQESINSDPQGLTKSLKDKEGLPPVFEEVEEIKSRHLTVKTKTEHLPGLEAILNAQEADPAFAKWAIVPMVLCLLGIFGLVGLFLFRRVFVRRIKPGTKHNDGINIFLNGGGNVKKAFVRSKYNPDDEKKKKRRGYEDDDDDYTRDHHMMGNEESTGSSEEGYEHRESRRDRSNRSRDAFSSSMGSHSHNSSGNASTVAKSTRSARAERKNQSSRDDEQSRSTRSSQRKSKRKPVGDRPID